MLAFRDVLVRVGRERWEEVVGALGLELCEKMEFFGEDLVELVGDVGGEKGLQIGSRLEVNRCMVDIEDCGLGRGLMHDVRSGFSDGCLSPGYLVGLLDMYVESGIRGA